MFVKRTKHGDGGLSDIIGTTMLLVVTVVIVGAAAVGFASTADDSGPAPRVELLATGEGTTAPDGTLVVRHTGGSSIPMSDLRLVLSSNSTDWSGPVSCPSLGCTISTTATVFDLGTTLTLTTPGKQIRPDDRVDILVYTGDAGTLVTQAAFVASGDGSTPTPLGFAVTRAATDTLSPTQGATILITADVTHPEGRKAIAQVVVDMLEVRGPTAFAMQDEGIYGDLRAGDGTYSAYVPIPLAAVVGNANLYVRALDLDGAATPRAAGAILVSVLPGAQVGPQGAQGLQGLTGAAGADGTPCTDVSICGPGSPGGAGQAGGACTDPTVCGAGAAGTPGAPGTNANPQGEPLDTLDITNMDPKEGFAGQVVKLSGTGLTDIVGVWMSEVGATPFIAYAVVYAPDPTAPVTTGLIFAVPDLTEGQYIVTVRRSDGSIDSPLDFFQVKELKPAGLSMAPNPTTALKTVTINGQNLDLVRSVLLVDGTTTYEAGWYVYGTAVKFIVPEEAAPLSQTPNFFTVRLAGDFTGTVDVSPQLQVDPTPAPVIFCPLNPAEGEPYTEITISGRNFVNVRSVLLGGDSLPFVPVSENRIVAITHAGLRLGLQYVTVTTATGSTTSTCQFDAQPLKLIPIYDELTFTYVATQTNVEVTSSGGDRVDLIVKLKLKDPSWSVLAQTGSGANKEYTEALPDKIGNSENAPQQLTVTKCAAAGVYKLTATDWVVSSQYDSTVYNLHYLLSIIVNKGSAGTASYDITTNDLSQYFVVAANVATTEVMDDGEPTDGFNTC